MQSGYSSLAREFGLNRRAVMREVENDSLRPLSQRAKPTQLSPAQLANAERRLAVCPQSVAPICTPN